jgi:hypothetical protein
MATLAETLARVKKLKTGVSAGTAIKGTAPESYGEDYASSGLYWKNEKPESIINELEINGEHYYTVRWADGSLHRVKVPTPTQKAEYQWGQTYQPKWEEYAEGLQRQAQTAYDRSLAQASARLGYGLSATGSGEGGLAEAARYGLESEAASKRADIAQQAKTMEQQAYLQFMQTKDQQAFEWAKMQAQMYYNKQIAEMNQPSWWESLAGIVGTAAALFAPPATGGASLFSIPTQYGLGTWVKGMTYGRL